MKRILLSLVMLLGLSVAAVAHADYPKDTVIAYGEDGYTEYSQAWVDKKAAVEKGDFVAAAEASPWSWVSAVYYVKAAWVLAGSVDATTGLHSYEKAVANKAAILELCKKAQAALNLSVKNQMEGTGKNTTKNTQHNITALVNAANGILATGK